MSVRADWQQQPQETFGQALDSERRFRISQPSLRLDASLTERARPINQSIVCFCNHQRSKL